MKVRILGNSIRYRLKQSEVKKFQLEGKISEVVEFGFAPTDALAFRLAVTEANEFKIAKSTDGVTLEVPVSVAEQWCNTSMVGIEKDIDTGKGKMIKILVEKDFRCLDRSDEEERDSFPNPNIIC